MPKLFVPATKQKKLPDEISIQMKNENLSMGHGDLSRSKVEAIKRERDDLRRQGYKVPRMPVCEVVQPKPPSKLGNP